MQASNENLNIGMKILKWFHIKSGLKINISKTKVIRLGNIRESDRRFGRENNLDWVTTYTAVGIQYNILDMPNITKLNIMDKLDGVKNIIKAWGCRNITPIGRIAVLKSLVLSKITHIIQSLPTPCDETFKTLEDMSYSFIWNKKRHEVKRQTLCKDIKDGGLNMLNIKEFEKSLKITWLRKLITTSPEWEEFAQYYKIDTLVYTDSVYHETIIKSINNPFWKNVAQSYTEWYKIFKSEIGIDITCVPIWGNPFMNLPFNPIWFKKGLY